MAFPQQAAAQSITQQQQWQMRYGCIAARIGADIQHKLSVDMPVAKPSHSTATDANCVGRKRGPRNPLPYVVAQDTSQPIAPGKPVPLVPTHIKAGHKVTVTVDDITRWPDEAAQGHWVCMHPECKGEKWSSKRYLLAAHPANAELTKLQQTHVYYCVVELSGKPAREAVAGKKNDKGEVVKAAIEAQEAVDSQLLLLSDEE